MKSHLISLIINYKGFTRVEWNVLLCKFINPLEDSSIINEKRLSKRIIEKLLNEILTTDSQEIERRIELFGEKNDIRRG